MRCLPTAAGCRPPPGGRRPPAPPQLAARSPALAGVAAGSRTRSHVLRNLLLTPSPSPSYCPIRPKGAPPLSSSFRLLLRSRLHQPGRLVNQGEIDRVVEPLAVVLQVR